ncbi:hypothetical protein LRK24_10200 [Rhodanobacter denitrificans]|uniref:hypothetical protein n=1 Tax=Rhodanobacter denitrificans TaxID=666685 RepID=UPI000260FED2|nr:hypothetical protein [Rhodanobacter denitrificans]EIM04112.1 hypothetical protein UUC_02790 [Rhodanobacter denitrificans]UJM88833.1 hypothetical protein LRK24_10200 [Rhodanobacter denitrificans]
MHALYRITVVLLLAALIGSVLVEGERIRKAIPAGYDVQDVRIINDKNDAVPVSVGGAVEVNGGTITGMGRLNGELPVRVRVEP